MIVNYYCAEKKKKKRKEIKEKEKKKGDNISSRQSWGYK